MRYRSELGGHEFIGGWGLAAISGMPGIRLAAFRAPVEPSVAPDETLPIGAHTWIAPLRPTMRRSFGWSLSRKARPWTPVRARIDGGVPWQTGRAAGREGGRF